jgi:hypothetical protein
LIGSKGEQVTGPKWSSFGERFGQRATMKSTVETDASGSIPRRKILDKQGKSYSRERSLSTVLGARTALLIDESP